MQDREGYVEQTELAIEAAAQEMQADFLTTPDPPNTEVPANFNLMDPLLLWE